MYIIQAGHQFFIASCHNKMNKGYGYSVWLVTPKHPLLEKWIHTYNQHIFTPHTTLKSNLTLKDAKTYVKHLPTLVGEISFQGQCVRELPRGEYNNDPLYGWGLKVKLHGFHMEHTPHLTIHYSQKPLKSIPRLCPKKHRFAAVVCIADTRSLKPEKWKILL